MRKDVNLSEFDKYFQQKQMENEGSSLAKIVKNKFGYFLQTFSMFKGIRVQQNASPKRITKKLRTTIISREIKSPKYRIKRNPDTLLSMTLFSKGSRANSRGSSPKNKMNELSPKERFIGRSKTSNMMSTETRFRSTKSTMRRTNISLFKNENRLKVAKDSCDAASSFSSISSKKKNPKNEGSCKKWGKGSRGLDELKRKYKPLFEI